MAQSYESYADFWPAYLDDHKNHVTRTLHLFGTGLAIGLIVKGLIEMHPIGTPFALVFALVALYIPGWCGHFFVDQKKPQTWGHAKWSLMSDFRLFFLFITGQMMKEFKRQDIWKPPQEEAEDGPAQAGQKS